MAVELVALIPAMLIVAAICANLVAYMETCAAFDRAAAEAVRVEGISPGYGQYGAASRTSAISGLINESFGEGSGVRVSVESSELGALTGTDYGTGRGLLFSLLPSVRRYSCTMTYEPPFFPRGAFGIGFPHLEHTCTYIVDPFNPSGWS
ncbi:MAG: hypothetical protein ACOYIP_05255 [Coriobacteriales bacterium]|jgi:hypothetical protein